MKSVVIGDKIEINAELLREFYEKSDHRSEIVQVINIQEEQFTRRPERWSLIPSTLANLWNFRDGSAYIS